MKIAMISHLVYPYFLGGVEKYVYYISKELMNLGHTVEIYTTDPTGKYCGEEEIDGMIIHSFRSIAPNGIYYFSSRLFRTLVTIRKFDVVHSNAYGTFAVLASVMAKRVNKTPTIVQTHLAAPKASRSLHQLYDPVVGAYIFDTCDEIVLVSRAEYKALSVLRNYSQKVTVIPNGIDFSKVNRFYGQSPRSHSKEETLQLLCVSRLERMKGIEHTLRIVKEVAKELPVSLTIVGEGPERYHLEKISRELGLAKTIRFLGRIKEDDLYQIYSETDVFLSLSNYESNSMSLIEAMAFGVVPVATNVGGNSYTIENGKTGFLTPYPVEELAVRMRLEYLFNNRDLLLKLKANARKKALLEFDIKKNVASLVKLYENVLIQD